jgi:hypothetical protein
MPCTLESSRVAVTETGAESEFEVDYFLPFRGGVTAADASALRLSLADLISGNCMDEKYEEYEVYEERVSCRAKVRL